MHQRRQKREHAVSRLKSRVRALKIYSLGRFKTKLPQNATLPGCPVLSLVLICIPMWCFGLALHIQTDVSN